jgi:hypothetical protein
MPFDPRDPAQLAALRQAAELARPPPWGAVSPGTTIIPDGVPVLIQAAERRRALLRELEWCVEKRYMRGDVVVHLCPACGQDKMVGHAPDCRLSAEL